MACRKRLLIYLFWIWLFLIQASFVSAQDLYVSWVTATPNTGQAEDSVTLQARIGNHSPGTALVIQVQWFLSADGSITTDDMALGDVETLNAYLYQGEEITITKEITVPPFQDLDPPSFLGLIMDPYEYLWDDDRSNNSGAADFMYTGGPPHSFSDPIGDNYLDVTHVKACISGENLEVAITFLNPPPATVSGIMAIDLDQNPLTGLDNLNLPGAEAVAGFLYQEYQSSFYLLNASGTTDLFTLSLNDNQLSYSIPLSLLGNDTNMDLYWVLDNAVGATTTFDRAPDTGAFATDTDTVVVRHPGDTSIDVDIADPVAGESEPDFPNVKRLQAKVIGDQLHVILTYNHQVENLGAYPGSDGLFVWIDLDSDYSLCTGFTSTEERPPAFGIDYELRLQVDPLAGTVAELLKDDGNGEAEVIPMGLPLNDLFMGLSGDQIICRVPLGCLGFGDGSGALAVNNLNTREILNGTIDRAPDSSAWDLKTDTARPGQTCQFSPMHFNDPVDDSVGAFGMDNDELVGLDVCFGNRAFLFTIDYKKYLLSNDGATIIYLDTDRNPATGWEIHNITQDTQLGADYIFRTYWYTDELRQITKVLKCLPPEHVEVKNQLTTVTMANRLYVTLPFECIGNPTGQVDILMETASWGGGPVLLSNDNLPDMGVITLPAALLSGDFDGDSDVDGYDLSAFAAAYATNDSQADLNGDSIVDDLDVAVFAGNFGRPDSS